MNQTINAQETNKLALTVAIPTSLDTVSPIKQTDCGAALQIISRENFPTLFASKPDGSLFPQIAEAQDRNKNVITVTLSNEKAAGKDVKAADVINQLNLWKSTHQTTRIKSLKEVDSKKIQITYFREREALVPVELCAVGITEQTSPQIKIVSQSKMELAFDSLRKGDIQFWLKESSPNFLMRGLLAHNSDIKNLPTPSNSTTILRFSNSLKFSSADVRKQISSAIRKKEIIKLTLNNNVLPTDDIFPKQHPLYIPGNQLATAKTPKKDLIESLEIVTHVSAKNIAIAKGLASQFNRAGWKTKVKVLNQKSQIFAHLNACDSCIALTQVPHFSIDTLDLLGIRSDNAVEELTTAIEEYKVLPLWIDIENWFYTSATNSQIKTFESIF